MTLIERNKTTRLYWTGRQWVLDTIEGRLYLGDCSPEDAIAEFDAATDRAKSILVA